MNRSILSLLVLSFTLTSAESASYTVYRSEDNGRSWSRSDTGLPPESRVNAFTSTEDSILAGADSGPFISFDSGKTWQMSKITGSNSVRVTSLAAANDRVFAGTSEGAIFSSSDHGKSWHKNEEFPRRKVRSLHAVEGSIYVGTDADHVYKSSDGGRTWTRLAAGLPSPSQVFALTSVNGRLFAGLYAQGLYTWNTSEQKWLRVGASADLRPLALASFGNTLIAGHNPGGIYWSDDLDRTWKKWSLSTSTTPAATSPADNTDLFPLLNPSIAKNEITATLPPREAPIWEMAADSRMAIAGAGNGIYYSTDRARNWTRATTGLPSTAPGIAFLVDDSLILAAIHEKRSTCETKGP